jgi:hypothetical protein
MERLKHTGKELTANQLHTLASALVARSNLAGRLGMQYGGTGIFIRLLGISKISIGWITGISILVRILQKPL